MALATWYFGVSLTFLSLFCVTAQAQESWEQRAKDYLFGTSPAPRQLKPEEASFGLKRTLSLCAESAVRNLGHYDGFAANPQVHIPLPPDFEKARKLFGRFGLSGRFDDLEFKMNRAAEDATPSLMPFIDQAIQQLSFEESSKIAAGADDAATTHFRLIAGANLKNLIRPVIEKSLQEADAWKTLQLIDNSFHKLPMAPNLKFDMTDYVSEKTLNGIYLYMALKESKIRARPSSTGNEIIEQLFSQH